MAGTAGYKAKLYQGVYGATATVLVERAIDLACNSTPSFAETTDRGDGSAAPKEDQTLVKRTCRITCKMNARTGDASLTAILSAASLGVPRAIKYVNAIGTTIFDGDCYATPSDSSSLTGAAQYDIEFTPTTDGGRDWIYNGA